MYVKIKASPKSKFKQKVTTVKPWFDNECKHEREEYMRVKNKLKKIKSVDSALQLWRGKSTNSLLRLKTRFIINSCLTN